MRQARTNVAGAGVPMCKSSLVLSNDDSQLRLRTCDCGRAQPCCLVTPVVHVLWPVVLGHQGLTLCVEALNRPPGGHCWKVDGRRN